MNSGACIVRYDLVWKTASGGGMRSRSGLNIDKMVICDVKPGKEIIGAQLIVSFKNTVKHIAIKISEEPITTKPPIKVGMSSL